MWLLWVEVTLHFLEIARQHLHPLLPQGIEFLLLCLDFVMVIGVVDSGGFVYCLSLALTSFFARLSDLQRQRHGLGT